MRADEEQEYVDYLRARLPRLHRAAYLLCGDAHHADDLVQGTALALYRKWSRVRAADNMDGYVHRVLVNQFLGEKRRPWSRVLLSDRTPEPEPRAGVDLAERDAVREALALLGPRQRAVLVLRYYCDLPVEQTAAVLECSVGNVKSQTARGLARLRLLLTGLSEPNALVVKRGSGNE